MAMQFWEAKRKRERRTTLFLFVFFVLAVGVSFLFQVAFNALASGGEISAFPHAGVYLFSFISLVSLIYYLRYMGQGGSVVAESMGGIRIEANERHSPKVEMLLNIVQELAIASRQPMPAVYVIQANEINAFAAGITPEKAAITVTTGALEQLNREELQGVIAHEFGHVAGGDMKVGMRLAALLMGFFLLFSIGLRLLQGSFFSRNDDKKGGSFVLIALMILAAGCILWFAGSILRACVSREREYHADASAVEYTRNPNGITSALRKIQAVNEQVHDMPKSGLGYSHLYLDNRHFMSRLFATHPPLSKRIAILEGEEEKKVQ
jgi:heat shock protein HtpX